MKLNKTGEQTFILHYNFKEWLYIRVKKNNVPYSVLKGCWVSKRGKGNQQQKLILSWIKYILFT